MAYTAEKVITEVEAVDNKEYKLYEPSVEKNMLDKKVTIKKLVGTFSLDRLEHQKQQYEAQIAHMEAQIVIVNDKIAAIENLVTPLNLKD